MNRVDEIVSELLTSTAALGVWLLGGKVVVNNQPRNEVLAGAVKDSSVKPPLNLFIQGETHADFADWQLFADRIGAASLVVVFDDRSSLGLIRLRVRQAKQAIEQALADRRG